MRGVDPRLEFELPQDIMLQGLIREHPRLRRIRARELRGEARCPLRSLLLASLFNLDPHQYPGCPRCSSGRPFRATLQLRSARIRSVSIDLDQVASTHKGQNELFLTGGRDAQWSSIETEWNEGSQSDGDTPLYQEKGQERAVRGAQSRASRGNRAAD